MKTYVRYTYNVTSQSRIFGALTQESDSLDVNIYYFYDSTDGKLLATVNSDEKNGICYRYDGMGRLVGVLPTKKHKLRLRGANVFRKRHLRI